MKYAVTGGAGFIGSNLVDKLLKEGHEVIVIDNLSTGKRENINDDARLICFDLSNPSWPALIHSGLQGVDTIFHMAALARVQPSIDHPQKFHEVNVNGTLNLLIAAHDAGVRRIVYSASSSAYGDSSVFPTPETTPPNPLSPYGLQKLIGEQYCSIFSKVYEMETVSLRYFNVFGDRMAQEGAYCLVIGRFIDQLLQGFPMTVRGDGEQRRDFTYVGDVVNANILAATSTKVGAGEVLNIGNGDNRSINEIAALLGGDVEFVDAVLEPRITLADNTKARKLLGWKPTLTIEEWLPQYKKEVGL